MKYEIKIGVTAVRVAIALLASSSVIAVQAQQVQNSSDTDSDNSVKKVIITGSNIKTVDAETASPVQVITRKDITREGVTNVSDLIANLSASTNPNSPNSGLTDIGGDGTFAPGSSSASLRNLGEQSTLILVNGRRIATYGFANFTDVFSNIDTIPIDAIDRIEVLKSGASAIYGSDAVAGVINIITRSNYQGVEVSADASKSLQSHTFGTNKASITAGFGDLNEDGFNVLVNADLFKRNDVMWTDLLQYTNQTLVSNSPSFGSYSSYSYPGNIIDGASTQPVTGCAPNLIQGGLCKYDRYSQFQAVPQSDRGNFYSTATFNLGGGTQAFAEVSYSRSLTYYKEAFTYYGDGLNPVQWGNPLTGQPLTFNYLGLAANSPLNPTGDDGVGFRYRFVDAPTYNDISGSQFRVIGGLRGSFSQYDWESAAGIMGSRVVETQQGQFSSSGFIQEIGNYNNYRLNTNPNVALNYTADDPNFFAQPNGYHPGQVNSAAVLNTLFPVFGNTGKTQAEFVDSKISGPAFMLPAGAVDFALGGELRHESMDITPSANLLDADIVGYGSSSADSSRNVESAYTEFNFPLLKGLEMQTALRVDKYPDISAHFSPKIALRYAPTDALMFRATYENGFRAPNLVESATSVKYAFDNGTTDPLRCSQATALSNALNTQAGALAPNNPQAALLYARAESVQAAECSFGLADEVKNNPNLQPETSKSFSFGTVFEPVKGYSTSIDYWHIDRSNTIGLPSTAQLLSGAPVPPGTTINRAPLNVNADPTFTAAEIAEYGVTAGPLLGVERELINISQQSTSGIDLGFKSAQDIDGWGKLSTVVDAVYNLTYYDTSISTSTENLTGQYGFPHVVANATVIFDRNSFSNSLRFNYTGGYSLQEGQSDTAWNLTACEANGYTAQMCRVVSNRTIDYALAYTGYKNLTLGMNIINLFQQKAPPDFRAFGVGGIIPTSLQDAEGRMLRVSVNYKFK